MGKIALHLQRISVGQVDNNQAIVFDQIVVSEGNIGYNTLNGEISFNDPGTYGIIWWIIPQAIDAEQGAIFALQLSDNQRYYGNSNIQSTQIIGTSIIEVNDPLTATIVNLNGGDAYYSNSFPLKASLIVFSIGEAGASQECFLQQQLVHVLQQIIDFYPTSQISVFSTTVNTTSGIATALVGGPDRDAGVFVVQDGVTFVGIPIHSIYAVYIQDEYNDNFHYLPVPVDSKQCDVDEIIAIYTYFNTIMEVKIVMGFTIEATGQIYRNEYGIVVLSDSEGNTPIFINTNQISKIISEQELRSSTKGKVSIINTMSS